MFGYQRVRWWGDERCSCNSEAWETFSFIRNESTTFMMLVYIFFYPNDASVVELLIYIILGNYY